MGGGEVNVAYDGTLNDLGSANVDLLHVMDNFDLNQYLNSGADVHPSDGFTAVNGATISPRDIFNDSIPPSTSFTNLTTPGSTFLETPDDDYQTSPLFTDLGVDNPVDSDNWYPLFPDSDASATASAAAHASFMTRSISSSSGNPIVVHPGGELNRKRSSATASPATFSSPAVKHSDVAGVGARKRDKPLPPIVVDEHDTVALKRARNTAAARKSRAKKVAERDDLEAEIADLKAQVEHWKSLALGTASTQGSDEE